MSEALKLAAQLKDLALHTASGKSYVLLLNAADELERSEGWQKMAYKNGYEQGWRDALLTRNVTP